LKPRRVRFTHAAQGQIERENAWWSENREHADVFADEVEQALRVLALLPGAGTLYAHPSTPGLRRLYLRKIACHIYFTFDEREVIVRALWGARRGRGPFDRP
jgi:plasmid stabilization system protein ParE